ncbi:MAG: hypothetical protein V1647_04045 [Pseudomonadota bacterium]
MKLRSVFVFTFCFLSISLMAQNMGVDAFYSPAAVTANMEYNAAHALTATTPTVFSWVDLDIPGYDVKIRRTQTGFVVNEICVLDGFSSCVEDNTVKGMGKHLHVIYNYDNESGTVKGYYVEHVYKGEKEVTKYADGGDGFPFGYLTTESLYENGISGNFSKTF